MPDAPECVKPLHFKKDTTLRHQPVEGSSLLELMCTCQSVNEITWTRFDGCTSRKAFSSVLNCNKVTATCQAGTLLHTA